MLSVNYMSIKLEESCIGKQNRHKTAEKHHMLSVEHNMIYAINIKVTNNTLCNLAYKKKNLD